MKKIFIYLLLFVSLASAQNPLAGFDLTNHGVRIEPDRRVMVVLATLEAARTTNDTGDSVPSIVTPLSAEGKKFRELLRSDSVAINEDLRSRISQFVNQYKKRNPKLTDAEIVTPFISMAYTLSPVPELADPVITSDLPGSLLDVLDFAPLVREFYRRTSFSANLDEYIKTYQKAADARLRPSTREMVNDLLNYLHTRPQLVIGERIKTETQKTGSKKKTLQKTTIRERERHFYIVPEMLAPAGNIIFLNVKDDYYVILPPETDVSFSDVRRAFLQFVVDPLVLNNAKDISTMKPRINELLDERRKVNTNISPDIYMAVGRSLISAIDARQMEYLKSQISTAQARQKIATMKTDQEKRAVSAELERFKQSLADETALQLSEDYEKGSVLAFYFTDQLKGLEDSGFDIASSMREMILSLDAAKETNRLEQFADARKRALAARDERKKNPQAVRVAENPITTRLLEIQKTIDAKNFRQAETDLRLLLKSNPTEPRIHYNLGRVASLAAETIEEPEAQSVKLQEAKTAYGNVILKKTPDTDKALLSLTYVALAKIYEFYDDKAYAMRLYDEAIKLGSITGGAYKDALSAKQRLLKEQ